MARSDVSLVWEGYRRVINDVSFRWETHVPASMEGFAERGRHMFRGPYCIYVWVNDVLPSQGRTVLFRGERETFRSSDVFT